LNIILFYPIVNAFNIDWPQNWKKNASDIIESHSFLGKYLFLGSPWIVICGKSWGFSGGAPYFLHLIAWRCISVAVFDSLGPFPSSLSSQGWDEGREKASWCLVGPLQLLRIVAFWTLLWPNWTQCHHTDKLMLVYVLSRWLQLGTGGKTLPNHPPRDSLSFPFSSPLLLSRSVSSYIYLLLLQALCLSSLPHFGPFHFICFLIKVLSMWEVSTPMMMFPSGQSRAFFLSLFIYLFLFFWGPKGLGSTCPGSWTWKALQVRDTCMK
jgi:hypothetical protein